MRVGGGAGKTKFRQSQYVGGWKVPLSARGRRQVVQGSDFRPDGRRPFLLHDEADDPILQALPDGELDPNPRHAQPSHLVPVAERASGSRPTRGVFLTKVCDEGRGLDVNAGTFPGPR